MPRQKDCPHLAFADDLVGQKRLAGLALDAAAAAQTTCQKSICKPCGCTADILWHALCNPDARGAGNSVALSHFNDVEIFENERRARDPGVLDAQFNAVVPGDGAGAGLLGNVRLSYMQAVLVGLAT